MTQATVPPTTRAVASADRAQTLGKLHLWAEHQGRREGGLCRGWADDSWQEMPSWRFHRQVIRAALFLRERLHVSPGDNVLVVAPLGADRAVAEWAIVTLGAVAVVPDVEPSGSKTMDNLRPCPKAAIVGARFVAGLQGAMPSLKPETAIVVGADAPPPGMLGWAEVLELGGTLDTAERARGFRERAAALTPDMPALGEMHASNGSGVRVSSHAEVMDRLRTFWRAVPPSEGDIAYVSGAGAFTSVCLPVWAFFADGRTTTVFGTPGRDAEEIPRVRPHVLVGHVGASHSASRLAARERPEPLVPGAILDRVPRVRGILDRVALAVGARIKNPKADSSSIRDVITFDGVRVPDRSRRYP
jgi:hypothetical protein